MVEISRLQEIFTEKVLQQVRKNNVFSFNLKGHLLRTWDISPEVIRPPQLFPCGLAVKEYAFSAGDLGSIPGLGRFAGEGIGDHSSIPRLGRSPGEGIGYPLQYSCAPAPCSRARGQGRQLGCDSGYPWESLGAFLSHSIFPSIKGSSLCMVVIRHRHNPRKCPAQCLMGSSFTVSSAAGSGSALPDRCQVPATSGVSCSQQV